MDSLFPVMCYNRNMVNDIDPPNLAEVKGGTGNSFTWEQIPQHVADDSPGFREALYQYVLLLLEYNQQCNIMSRQMTPSTLSQLLNESLILNQYLSRDRQMIIDAGSGNGLLGIPLALKNKNIPVILVEPQKKKSHFLVQTREKMQLTGVDIQEISIEEYLKKQKIKKRNTCLISRGFPRLDALVNFVKNQAVTEAVIITSENIIKKNREHMDSLEQKIYNLPLRDHLKILRISRARFSNGENRRGYTKKK